MIRGVITILWKNWNDQLSLIVLFIIAALWVLGGIGIVKLPSEVTGATIVVLTLITQFYFRRKEPTESDPPKVS